MKFALSVLSVLALACTVLGAGPTYVLSNGVVSASVASPPACYVDANGNTVCPLARSAAPQACYPGGCSCLPAKTPFDPTTNCGTYLCPANGGVGKCPCQVAAASVNFAGGVSFPVPMAAGKDMGFFLDRPRLFRGHLRGFFGRLFHR